MRALPSAHRIKVVRIIARLNVGGPAIHVVNLNAGLDPQRFESILISGTENPGEGSMLDYALSKGIAPIVIPEIVGEASFKPRDAQALSKLVQLLRKEKPQIVHTHTAKAGFVGRVAARLAGVPVIIHTYHGHVLHGYYSPRKTQLLRQMEAILAHLTDHIIAVSERVKQDLVTYRVAPAEKIGVIPLGFDLAPFVAARANRGEFRREFGLDAHAPLIGIVGRIFPIKNHRLFLDAAARVAAQQSDARFVIVGDGTLRGEMESHTRELGLGERVVFTGWRRDLPRIYSDLDVLVVSSDNEGTPVSAIEAMASGCPVVATAVGGLPDLIADGETGCLVPAKSPDALANAVLSLLQNSPLAERLGAAAQASVLERFTVSRLIVDIERLYDRWLARKGIVA